MSDTGLSALWRLVSSLQAISMGVCAAITLGLGLTLVLSLSGFLPAFEATVAFADGTAFAVGPLLHGIAFCLALMLLCYMPANWRMRRLEAGHRSFRMGMEDVTRAYQVAHAADREGVFTCASEYDAVRERLAFLAEHPDLGHLEPGILEVAAQMSRTSEELARIYSDEAISRARSFIAERQAEAERMEDRIEQSLAICRELRALNDTVSLDEDIVASRINQLRDELDDILPRLGVAPPRPANKSDVIQFTGAMRPRDKVGE